MKKSRLSFGPGAASLILIVVILSMSILGILALMNAENDRRLSDRATQVVIAGYELNAQAERDFAGLCEQVHSLQEKGQPLDNMQLPSEMTWDGDCVAWTRTDGIRTLNCRARIGEEGVSWESHRLTAITEEEQWN